MYFYVVANNGDLSLCLLYMLLFFSFVFLFHLFLGTDVGKIK